MLLFVVVFSGALLAQQTITGKVTDAVTGEGLIGATVSVKGTAQGVATDFDGNYKITLLDGSNELVFSYTGYTNQTIKIDGRTEINVQLKVGVDVEEIVVVRAVALYRVVFLFCPVFASAIDPSFA